MAELAYHRLERRFRRIGALGDAAAVLHWDTATMMPAGGADARGDQLAELAAVRHGIVTAPETADLLSLAEAEGGLDAWQAANLREMKRTWAHASAVDEDLVAALSRATSKCEMVWRTARPANDFASVRPHLETVLSLVRETAEAKGTALGLSPYDALLDQYEPGGRAADVDVLFADLEAFLPPFLAQVLERQAAGPAPIRPKGPFPVERQKALAERLMARLGFDFDHGRLDVSAHPMCGGVPDDVRVTTRYTEDDFTRSLMAVLHETGHALYERGLPAAWRGQPAGEARGMSVHESQSLLVEMQVCRSAPFLAFAAPLLAEAFGGKGRAWQPANLHRLFTRVEPGLIRVDADEVTYPLHVILRTRLERAMIDGTLEVADLPEAWNQGMKDLLGLVPPGDGDGCMQDIHWYDGAWGYFPTYTLGALTAAQLFEAAQVADPAIASGVFRGDFAPLNEWLRRHVHERASLLPVADLLAEATGRPLDTTAFKAHVQRRYLA